MKKLTANAPETRSADILAENIEQLKTLFPEAFTEGKIDFEVMRQLLGGAVDERDEKYGLNWHGKRRTRQLALMPSTGTLRPCPEDSVNWDTTQNLMIEEKRILWPANSDGRPRRKSFLLELDSNFTGFSTIVGEDVFTRDGTADVDSLFDVRIFNFPKPVRLISILVEQGSAGGDIILDFFAGAGSTVHAVMAQNAADGGNRRYILVQLPELLDPENNEQKTASDFCDKLKKSRNIAELTKKRLRRAGKKTKEESPMFAGDLGFRVFKLDSSNIRAWEPDRDNLPKTLDESVKHLKSDRTEADILYELLLKLGLDLCVPLDQQTIAGTTVHSIGDGVLLACLAEKITRDDVEPLAQGIVAWHKTLAPAGDTTCVFLDNAFADDVVKTNLAAILNQHGLANVRSLLRISLRSRHKGLALVT